MELDLSEIFALEVLFSFFVVIVLLLLIFDDDDLDVADLVVVDLGVANFETADFEAPDLDAVAAVVFLFEAVALLLFVVFCCPEDVDATTPYTQIV